MQIFDVPSMGDRPFEERIEHLKKTFGPGGLYASASVSAATSDEKSGDDETRGVVVLVHQELAKSREHVLEKLKEVEKVGGEGLMLRRAESCVSDTPFC
jgi:DNA ligase-1